MIGMILWPNAKRSISASTAREIAAAARQHGALPVGVFVDEDAATIARVCEEAEITVAQLHGDGSRLALLDLPKSLAAVYVMHANKSGTLQTLLPRELATSVGRTLGRDVDYVLLDSLQGGSGERFDWRNLVAPVGASKRGWLLAGGLTPDNVAAAIAATGVQSVDTASGVESAPGRKDPERVRAFVSRALAAFAARSGGSPGSAQAPFPFPADG